jgi:hypothetical protein
MLKNGYAIEIFDMPMEKYSELLTLIESQSDERFYIAGSGYFSPKTIVKISRYESSFG